MISHEFSWKPENLGLDVVDDDDCYYFFINDDLEAENEDEDRHLDDLDDLVLYQGILRNMHHRAKKIDFQQPRELQPRIIIINYCCHYSVTLLHSEACLESSSQIHGNALISRSMVCCSHRMLATALTTCTRAQEMLILDMGRFILGTSGT